MIIKYFLIPVWFKPKYIKVNDPDHLGRSNKVHSPTHTLTPTCVKLTHFSKSQQCKLYPEKFKIVSLLTAISYGHKYNMQEKIINEDGKIQK